MRSRQQFPVKVSTFAVDLAQRGSAQRVAETCGDVDILVNNAGDVPSGSLEAMEEDRWRAGWDTKVFNYINLSREYFAPHESAAERRDRQFDRYRRRSA